MTRQAVFIALCLILAVTTSCFGFVQALLGGCDDIEKDLRFEKTLREKCNKDLEEANQRAADADDVKRQLEDRQNDVKKLKNDIEKLKKEKEYVRGEASEYENMLIREQAECRKKDKRCKASEEQLQQSQNKLTECEDKLIDCGGTQSVQAKKHVEFLKGQIDDLKKHRDRLELELEETQTSFRNLRYTETICQSNYSDLVQQHSEYKNRIQSLQNENQAYQKTGGAGGTLQFYSDYSHILLSGAVITIFYLLFHNNSLKEKAKHATELREEAEKRHSQNAVSKSSNKKKTKNAKSETKVEDGEVFSADDEDEEDEYEEEQQESDAEDGKIEDNTDSSQSLREERKPNHPASKPKNGSSQSLLARRTPNHPASKPSKGEAETSASVMSVNGGTVSTEGEPTVKLEDEGKLIKTEVGGLVEKEIAGVNEKVTTTMSMQQQVGAEMENKVGGFQEINDKCEGQVNDGKNKTTELEHRVADVETKMSDRENKMDERISGVESEIDKIKKKFIDADELKTHGAVNQMLKDGQTGYGDGAGTGVFSITDDGKNDEHSNEEVSIKLGSGEPPGENIDRTSPDKEQTDPGMGSDEANLYQDSTKFNASQPSQPYTEDQKEVTIESHSGGGDAPKEEEASKEKKDQDSGKGTDEANIQGDSTKFNAGQPSQPSSGNQKEVTIESPGGGDTQKEESKENKEQENLVSNAASGVKSKEEPKKNSSGKEEKESDPEAGPPKTLV